MNNNIYINELHLSYNKQLNRVNYKKFEIKVSLAYKYFFKIDKKI